MAYRWGHHWLSSQQYHADKWATNLIKSRSIITYLYRIYLQGYRFSQKFLFIFWEINQTLVYAKVYDETVRRQFAAAMKEIEAITRRQLAPTQCNEAVTLSPIGENRFGVSGQLHQVEENVSICTDSV